MLDILGSALQTTRTFLLHHMLCVAGRNSPGPAASTASSAYLSWVSRQCCISYLSIRTPNMLTLPLVQYVYCVLIIYLPKFLPAEPVESTTISLFLPRAFHVGAHFSFPDNNALACSASVSLCSLGGASIPRAHLFILRCRLIFWLYSSAASLVSLENLHNH
jgi:hypothetical protein